jgi:RNA ligase-like protein
MKEQSMISQGPGAIGQVDGATMARDATALPPFIEFPKIARLSRDVVVTEKIDGTNAQAHVTEAGEVYAGSRTRWITTATDNHGFARWVEENRADLLKLGPGSHFGEWWGSGIQRRYGLADKRFSLFNVHRWGDPAARPTCCHVVPVLWRGSFDDLRAADILDILRAGGSQAAPGFMKPEGIVVFHTAAGALFKKTIEKDNEPKGPPHPGPAPSGDPTQPAPRPSEKDLLSGGHP